MPKEEPDAYATIREVIGDFIGTTLVEITQQDEEEWEEGHVSYVALHFSNGCTITFPIGDAGFETEGAR